MKKNIDIIERKEYKENIDAVKLVSKKFWRDKNECDSLSEKRRYVL